MINDPRSMILERSDTLWRWYMKIRQWHIQEHPLVKAVAMRPLIKI